MKILGSDGLAREISRVQQEEDTRRSIQLSFSHTSISPDESVRSWFEWIEQHIAGVKMLLCRPVVKDRPRLMADTFAGLDYEIKRLEQANGPSLAREGSPL